MIDTEALRREIAACSGGHGCAEKCSLKEMQKCEKQYRLYREMRQNKARPDADPRAKLTPMAYIMMRLRIHGGL